MTKKRKKSKKEQDSISRRDVLKMGAAAGAASVLGPTMLTSRKTSAQEFQEPIDSGDSGDLGGVGPPPVEPILCGTAPPVSPPTRPFVDFLPIPASLGRMQLNPRPTKKANTGGGEAARADHQRWEEFLPEAEYELVARAGTHRFHADLLPSYIWGFNGRYPAPTIRGNYGEPSIVRFKNKLPASTTSFGRNETTIHLHNGHTASESDGFAGDFFGVNLFKDNHYANAYAGIDAFGGIGDPREAMRTFWFHDHRAAFTANNNYLGLNGMYLLYDSVDPGHENNTSGSLRLPGIFGVTDIPLILTDKRFCAVGNGRNELFQVPGDGAPGGDKWVVNGKIQPKLSVRRRKYRFRILNTGPAKTWTLSLIKPDGTQGTMSVVAADANFLVNPWHLSTAPLTIFVASRYDVIIDFGAFPIGSKLYLKEGAPQNVGATAPEPLPPGLAIENVLMRFDVIANTIIPDTPPIPKKLVDLPPLPEASDCFQWRFTNEPPFGSPPGTPNQFQINEQPFDANRVDWVVLKGTSEEWELKNDVLAGNWTHPVHIHFEEGRIIERTIRRDVGLPTERIEVVPLNPDEDWRNARRDVYPLPGQNSIKLRMFFRDFVGRYLIHCHNMNHEDDFMMVRWDIVATAEERDKRRAEIIAARKAKGLPIVNCGERRLA